MDSDSDRYNIKTVERAFQILDFACEQSGPVSIQDIGSALDINTNMTFRLLASLLNSGYMIKDPSTGLYSVSLKSLRLSRNALHSVEIRRVCMPYLELLWNVFPKANLNMAVYYQEDVLVIDRIDSQSLPRTYFTPGRTLPFHCTGLGKILTCTLPEEELDLLIKNRGLKQYTVNTITSAEGIKEELKRVRLEQVGRDRNEFISGDNCSAVPIYGKGGQIIAGISISALEPYMKEEEVEASIPKLRETAMKISYTMGFNEGI
jgi:DNA-binding IclR family transcriptional regulator